MVIQLELSRGHTSHAASASICRATMLQQQQHDVIYLLTDFTYLPTYTRPVVCKSRKHMASSAVGAVDRRGQQNTLFVMFVVRAKQFQAYWSQFFAEFYRFVVLIRVAQMPRSWDLAIFVPTMTDDDDVRQNWLLYPSCMAQDNKGLKTGSGRDLSLITHPLPRTQGRSRIQIIVLFLIPLESSFETLHASLYIVPIPSDFSQHCQVYATYTLKHYCTKSLVHRTSYSWMLQVWKLSQQHC